MAWGLDDLRQRRDELLARQLPAVTLDQMLKIDLSDDATVEDRAGLERWWKEEGAKIDTYLSSFVLGLVLEDGKEVAGAGGCPCCLAELGGFLGAFQWGLVHGEGTCSRCGWPVTAYHYLYLDDRGDRRGRLKPEHRDQRGEADVTLRFMLPAHPSGVLLRGEELVFELEVEHPRDPDDRRSIRTTWASSEEDRAAQEYESEASPQNVSWEQIVDELRELGRLEHVDDETERTVTLTRVIRQKEG
jgi:hypothetical protein